MRKALKEYNFDWMLYSTFGAASRLKKGTGKEYRSCARTTFPTSGALSK